MLIYILLKTLEMNVERTMKMSRDGLYTEGKRKNES